MTIFVVVTGIGHAATQWLSFVLDRPEQGVRFEHEPLMQLSRPSWEDARMAELRGSTSEFFADYWPYVEDKLKQYRIYGDVMSWMPVGLSTLNERIPIDRVIFLVRHGIPQLHSIWYASLWHKQSAWLYRHYLRQYWSLAGEPRKPWEDWSRWEKICLWWNTNAFMPDRVRGLCETEVVKMEDLTRRPAALVEFAASFGLSIDDPAGLQEQDMNRKIDGNRSPQYLWATWTHEQRRLFREICGDGLKKLDYGDF